MLTCHQFTELADRDIDDELGWWTAWRVRRHLRICRYCRYFRGQMVRTQELGRTCLQADGPVDGEDELLAVFRDPPEA